MACSERTLRQPPGLGDRVPWERLCQRRDELHQHDDAVAGDLNGILVNGNNQLTALGSTYANAPGS
jgi:hypothetical protein